MYNGSAEDRQHTARILCKGVTHSGGNVIQELQCDGEAPAATVIQLCAPVAEGQWKGA